MGVKQFQKEVERKNKVIDEQNKEILKCQDKIRAIQKKILMNEWYKKFTDKSIVMNEEDKIKGLYQFTSDVSRYYHPDAIMLELKKRGSSTDGFEKFYSKFTKVKLICGEYENKSYQIDTLQDLKKEIILLDTVQFCCDALYYATVEWEAKESQLKKELCDFKEGRIDLESKRERAQKKTLNTTKKIVKGTGKSILDLGKEIAKDTLFGTTNKW